VGRDNQDDAEHLNAALGEDNIVRGEGNIVRSEGNIVRHEDNAAHGAYKLYHPILDGQSVL
jgi:hypothetical protein